MPRLPVVSGIKVVKALAKIGYDVDHQTGSHVILRQREDPHRRLSLTGPFMVTDAGFAVPVYVYLLAGSDAWGDMVSVCTRAGRLVGVI